MFADFSPAMPLLFLLSDTTAGFKEGSYWNKLVTVVDWYPEINVTLAAASSVPW